MESKIWLSSPHMSGKEQSYINNAFETNWIAPLGPHVSGFESDIQNYLQEYRQVAALSSGTAAIHLSLILLGVTNGDEVICQSKTFSASANPIVYLGATPVFVDSEASTWNMCPEQLENAIKDRLEKGKKPKAIIAVHLYGMPYQVDEIHRIAERYDIPVIEDSAEAFGSHYNNRKCGTFGEFAILSFNGNKIITTSGGGALVTNSLKMKERAIFLATQAREKAVEYLHEAIGYNYRLSNVLAGIGRGQIQVLDDRVKARRRNFETYASELRDIEELTFNTEPDGFYSNRWLTAVLTPSEDVREGIRNALDQQNIESRPLWKPMHQQPVFKDAPNYLNGVSDELFHRGLCLPSGSNLSENELDRVISAIKMYFRV
ncbi:DegT/DnrJ/EryC1/StrS family aminotransferase [Psychroserpens sp.]|uniref:DegT/DnrJ/EryC1/StrS family aminotransferase n=1 Tax=Psychroserpens sp. TaxID=2020870 RepID=UPI001B2D201B|nr:aminotransferase class I/II-fold pyridoxal phosphate-dependent enzyme [Psychroserpens sp.]MBO6606490.1 aminotransferase class I/II-fold pyridoxal phosphate-dependent enzyme [Psychroserpens sp.]MBO6632397.1 aminotransferase class I/II-fold pyridoxal phosphate-dependent enzyme [Psychroserpens sp.]MBO6653194.1 aminotransferase class I/II-fold pyridoxal phosphate-dependent enzyme [Psychroserpens sp.]MBO6680778.1 aminotransferase class I/II-fold pyridoxal phosphate-dependent enzyme [Psychroserpen